MAESRLEPTGNRLPARLPPEEMERLLPHLGHVSFALGEVIYESGGRQSYIYFPTTACSAKRHHLTAARLAA